MNSKPKCIIVTGRAGAGKTTLSKKLGRQLWMPVISRDEIKEGYVNTFGVKHDQLSPDTDGFVSNFSYDECLLQRQSFYSANSKLLKSANTQLLLKVL